MKWCALLLAACSCLSGEVRATFTGVVHDNRCVGPNCARQCPVTKNPVYSLQAGDEAWVLIDRTPPARFVGKRVVVTGKVGTDNKLHVISIAPAR